MTVASGLRLDPGECDRWLGCALLVVELTRAVAVAEAQGPKAGLDRVDRLALQDYRYPHSTRGELLRRLGRTAEAREAYRWRWRWSTTTPSGAYWSGGWLSSAPRNPSSGMLR